MLEFICSTCGKRVQGDESLAGMRVLCPTCNVAMTAPEPVQAVTAVATPEHAAQAKITMTRAAGDGSFCEGAPPYPPPPALPLQEAAPHFVRHAVPYLILGIIVLFAVALLVPAVQKVRAAAARTQSTNNLKQIGLAFINFHDTNRRLPYNGTSVPFMADGNRSGGPAAAKDPTTGSWAFMIIPFMDQNPIFTELSPNGIAAYMCPGRGRPVMCTGAGGPCAWSDYAINPFLNNIDGAFDVPDARRTMISIADGVSNTVFVGHGQMNPGDYSSNDLTMGFTDSIFKGGSPALCRANPQVVLAQDSAAAAPGNWGAPFPQGALACLGDGTVRVFPYRMTGGVIVNGACHTVGDVDFGNGPAINVGFGPFLTPCGGDACMIPES